MRFKSNPFKIVVRTNMSKTEITGFDSEKEVYRMNVHALPEKGKANLEIVKLFKKEYGRDVKIVSGKTSKRKLVRIL